MLPKLEVHFGDEVLHVPQTVRLNLIMFAHCKDTLKENILESYRLRTLNEKKHTGAKYSDITLRDAESQLVSDLKEYGNDFVLEQVYKESKGTVIADTLMTPHYWLSDEEEVFDRKVE